jgi:hypothetical protein
MATAVEKITLSASRDIPFNKLVLSQANVRRVKAGISIEELAEDIARRTLLQSLSVRAVADAEVGRVRAGQAHRRLDRATDFEFRVEIATPAVMGADGTRRQERDNAESAGDERAEAATG